MDYLIVRKQGGNNITIILLARARAACRCVYGSKRIGNNVYS